MIALKTNTAAGNLTIETQASGWEFSLRKTEKQGGLEIYHFHLQAASPQVPPECMIAFQVPAADMQYRWHTRYEGNLLPGFWPTFMDYCCLDTALGLSAPVVLFGNQKGNNRILCALSEAMRPVKFYAGIYEETNEMCFRLKLFSVPEAPIDSYDFALRIDRRNIFYADAIREAFAWYETFPEYKSAETPEGAYDALYSTWYSYHQNVHAPEMLQECRLSKELGIKTIIVDDGWQTDDTNRGYAFCGDWEVSKNRFPDFAKHVDEVHALGIKYMIWFTVPYIGCKSRNYEQFKDKFLWWDTNASAGVLDPRFPEVREFLIQTWERAMRDWHLDGLKLDFIDAISLPQTGDPALKDNYAGRDIKSVPLALDKLLSDAMKRISAICPGALIEFRQNYIGPAIRKYGNMLRAGDCPADAKTNRLRTINLRLSSGKTAVHSDMLEWSAEDTPETAALQFLNVLFSVPQISVRLAEISEPHRQMLRFWMKFWEDHRDLLLKGYLKPMHPEFLYPVVTAEKDSEFLAAVYAPGMVAELPGKPGMTVYAVNASESDVLNLKLEAAPKSAVVYDACGREKAIALPASGLQELRVPESGLLVLKF